MRNKYLLAGLFPLLLAYSIAVKAIEPIEPVGKSVVAITASNIELINDPEKKYSIDDIASGKAGNFVPAPKTNFGFGYKGVMWVKMIIDFSNTDKSNLFLIEKYFHLGTIKVYQKSDTGFDVIEETEHRKLEERKYIFNEFIFDITNTKKDKHVVYVRIDPEHHALRLEFEITDSEGLVAKINETQFALGMFFGGLLTMLFYNLGILLYLRKNTYLYYIYYLFSFIIVFWYLSGYAPIFVAASKTVDKVFTIFGYTAIHGLLLFARRFLLLQGKYKLICKIFEYIALVSIGLIFILPINPFVILNFLLIASMLFLAVTGAKRIYDGFKPAVLYFIGWLAFAISGIAYAIRSLGYSEISFFTKYGLMTASVWEAVFFALALAYSFKLIEKENTQNLESMLSQKGELNKTVRDVEDFKMKLGQDLHDELGQRMVALKFGATMLESNPSAENVKKLSREIINTINKIQSEVDNILEGLRPPILESLGLSGTIQAIVNEYKRILSDIHVEVHIDADLEPRIEPAIQIVLFRVIQEALTNAFRHANATRITISIGISTTCTHLKFVDKFECFPEGVLRVEARVMDNGVGFDPTAVSFGQGLSGMKKRVVELIGIFNVVSSPNKGTIVMVSIPCESQNFLNDARLISHG